MPAAGLTCQSIVVFVCAVDKGYGLRPRSWRV